MAMAKNNFSTTRLIHCTTVLVISLLIAPPRATAASSEPSSTIIPSIIPKSTAADTNTNTIMSEPKSMPSSTYKHAGTLIHYPAAVFSDVDGTLVHYPKHLQKKNEGSEHDVNNNDKDGLILIHLPQSKTGTRGVISARTLTLCHRLRHGIDDGREEGTANMLVSSKEQRMRNGGVPFVLVSGMRTTTLFQRLPYLPRADAYVSESGGRIFYPCPIRPDDDMNGLVKDLTIHPISYPGISPSGAAPFVLVEDMEWRRRISQRNSAGSDGYDNDTPIEQRQGKLWEFARTLKKQGYVLDNSGYATAYRINRKHQNDELAMSFDDFLKKCARKEGIPDELGCSTNLGCVDIYPNMSGKRNCAEYLVQKFLQQQQQQKQEEDQVGNASQQSISLKTHAFCMCDDDNDIEMALACKAAYLPSVTSESIRNLVNSDDESGGRLVVTEDATMGIVESLATEAALEAIMKELQ